MKVITSLRTFRHGSSLRTWLYRITVHHFLNTRRRSRESTVAFEVPRWAKWRVAVP